MHQALLSFNAGELSPYLRHRVDFDKVASGAQLLENFISLPYGSIIKRPGLVHLGSTPGPGANSCLLPFISSDGSRYLLRFTPGLLTIHGIDGTVKDTCPFMPGFDWDADDWEQNIRALQIVQINDVAFITHPGTFPLRLSRNSDTDWTLEFIPFERAPMLDENLDKNQTFTVASDPVAPMWAWGEMYHHGDVVFTGAEWVCTMAHGADSTNMPGVGKDAYKYWDRNTYKAGDPVTVLSDFRAAILWDFNYQQYNLQNIRRIDSSWNASTHGIIYCRANHVTTADSAFPTDYSYTLGDTGLPPLKPWWYVYAWAAGGSPRTYVLGNGVHHNGKIYRALGTSDNTDPASEPGVGASWSVYWAEFENMPATTPELWIKSFDYQVGERRGAGGRLFECIQQHTPTALNRPPAAAWESYWIEIERMVPYFEANAFTPGQHFRISPERDQRDFQVELKATTINNMGRSASIAVQGGWDFFTYGTWAGTFQLERSANRGATWEVIRSWQSSNDRNVAASGVEDQPVMMRLRFIAQSSMGTGSVGTAGSGDQRGVLIPQLPYVTGYALLDSYLDGDIMTGKAVTNLMSGNTFRWARGAFNSRDGYPRAIALHENRLCFAATNRRPVSLWLSAVDDLNNFETGPLATDAIFSSLALTNASPIRWLASQRRLFLGTAFGEWVCGSETTDAPLSATNFLARQYSSYGSHGVQPLLARDATFFVERKGTRLRELSYDDARGSYDAVDLSRMAEHLTQAGIMAMAWQQTREPGLWVVTRDGRLLHFAYNRTERIAAWSRHSTRNGLFRDVVVMPSDDGDDEVFFVVERGGACFIERFPQHWIAAQETRQGWFHLDGIQGSGTVIPVPLHLRSTPVSLVTVPASNPSAVPTVSVLTITGSTYTLAAPSSWQLGLPITSKLHSLPVDVSAQDGTTQGRSKRLHKVLLSLLNSRGGGLWNRNEDAIQAIPNTQPELVLRSGWEEAIPDPGHVTDLQLRLHHSDPFPFVLLSAVLRFLVHER